MPAVVYTCKMDTQTLGLLPRLLLAAETTEEQPLLQFCILTLVHRLGRTGLVFRILAAKESGGTEGSDIQTVVYNEARVPGRAL